MTAGLTLAGVSACSGSPASAGPGITTPAHRADGFPAAPAGKPLVCGQPELNSPFSYDGPAGHFTSGTAGLPTYGTPGSNFPHATSGVVIPAGSNEYASFQLQPDTVYYLLPGVHNGRFQADTGDVFIGGRAGGVGTTLSGGYSGIPWSIDSNSSNGDQSGVTIEYLTIENYQPNGDSAAVNPDANTGWTIQYDTVTLNVPGAGIMLGANGVLRHDCLTLNGQYGFQSTATDAWGTDSLTGGPYNLTVADNEISYNDTCDFSNLVNNQAIGWNGHNPVPARYHNPHCGVVHGDGNQGGFKLWRTNGVTIAGNYIHNNWGPGGWADTDNANTTWTGNTITGNEGAGIFEEISYNFSITGNYLADNNIADGLGNSRFPSPAIYISESGSDRAFGGVPACPEPSCASQHSYPDTSVISGNTLVNNGGSVFLWQNSNRFCSDGQDHVCTLVDGGPAGPFTMSACAANLPAASVDTGTFRGQTTGSPAQDWFDGCTWKTENVRITGNTIDFDPANVLDCNRTAWPACGAGGVFSDYGGGSAKVPGWVVATELTFYQDNLWSQNMYHGPSTFYVWNQGNTENPVGWHAWNTRSVTSGDACGSQGTRQSGLCTGPFGQDSGSSYRT